jgi:toxin-antitoxin system, antitoxin component, xre family
MEINIITNDEELQVMSDRLNAFLDRHRDDIDHLSKQDAEELELMSLVIGAYEKRRFPLPEVEPIDFIKFMMEQKELKVKDLVPCFGTTSRAYEVLSGKRKLTLAMIKKLRVTLGCPADALIEA